MAELAVATAGRRWVFEGREVTLPVVIRDAASAVATYLVPSAAARRLLPGPELDVVELLPGRALFSIAAIDYRDNDLGDYNEVSLALFVHRRGERAGVPYLGPALDFMRNRVATYIWKLPVDQRFTCAAGAASGASRRASSRSRSRTWPAGGAAGSSSMDGTCSRSPSRAAASVRCPMPP